MFLFLSSIGYHRIKIRFIETLFLKDKGKTIDSLFSKEICKKRGTLEMYFIAAKVNAYVFFAGVVYLFIGIITLLVSLFLLGFFLFVIVFAFILLIVFLYDKTGDLKLKKKKKKS